MSDSILAAADGGKFDAIVETTGWLTDEPSTIHVLEGGSAACGAAPDASRRTHANDARAQLEQGEARLCSACRSAARSNVEPDGGQRRAGVGAGAVRARPSVAIEVPGVVQRAELSTAEAVAVGVGIIAVSAAAGALLVR